MQDEGSNGTAAAGARSAGGLHKNPYRVTVKSDGRVSTIGRCTPVRSSEVVSWAPEASRQVRWLRYDIERLLFSQTGTLLVLQGLPLMKFFEGVFFDSPNFSLRGTFVFLRGELSSVARPPMTMSNIVLGRILDAPESLEHSEVLAALLQDVLSQGASPSQ